MITIILSVILFGFGFGVWFSQYNVCFALFDYVPNSIVDYVGVISSGCFFGFFIGFSLSLYLSKFVARKYSVNNKFPLSPFSDGETYLVNNDGNINYCRAEEDVRTANKHDIAYIKVNDKEDFPYVAYCQPERASFWGLFATFIMFSPNNIFVVPKEAMIKKGRVDIITTTTHKLMLEP